MGLQWIHRLVENLNCIGLTAFLSKSNVWFLLCWTPWLWSVIGGVTLLGDALDTSNLFNKLILLCFRISLLVISMSCVVMTVCLTIYTRHHRRVKVFRVASPVFLSITLLGCAIMYMEVISEIEIHHKWLNYNIRSSWNISYVVKLRDPYLYVASSN